MARLTMRPTPLRNRPGAQKFLVEELVGALYHCFCRLRDQQQTTLLELSGTPEDRFELSCQVATHLYTSGIGGYGARVVQMYLHEGEIQAMFYNFLCGDREETLVKNTMETVLERWCGLGHQQERTTYGTPPPPLDAQTWRQEYQGDFLDEPTTKPDDFMSQMPSRSRSSRRNVQQGRSGRDPRRTGRCDERPVPELLP